MSIAFVVAAVSTVMAPLGAAPWQVDDEPFVQEYHEPFPITPDPKAAANDVRRVAVDKRGNVWAATAGGLYVLTPDAGEWSAPMADEGAGPVFDVTSGPEETVWAGAWNGLWRFEGPVSGTGERIASVEGPIAAVCPARLGVAAIGTEGLWRIEKGEVVREPLQCSRSVRSITPDVAGGLWISTGMGLFHDKFRGRDILYQDEEDILAANVSGVAVAYDHRVWAGGLGGITVYDSGLPVRTFTPADGLPSVFVQSVDFDHNETLWVGTDKGVARFDGKSWSLRHSRRWLLDDDVRDVAFDRHGTAWVATARGVSAIKRREMTLAEKEAWFYENCMERHVRDPWLVEKCRLPVPGDTSKWEPEDDDNDGEYTSMYLVMESCRYAATKDADARDKAKKAFEALRFLQTVTETPGFVARTVIPSTWTSMHDPGDKFTDREIAARRVEDPRYKVVSKRWRPSSDGKWLWKGDTSSDEITGHFYGYLYYYNLVADEAERKHVAEHVRKIMDYIIDGGYVLCDIDGTHTRWGVWSPELLKGDADWGGGTRYQCPRDSVVLEGDLSHDRG